MAVRECLYGAQSDQVGHVRINVTMLTNAHIAQQLDGRDDVTIKLLANGSAWTVAYAPSYQI